MQENDYLRGMGDSFFGTAASNIGQGWRFGITCAFLFTKWKGNRTDFLRRKAGPSTIFRNHRDLIHSVGGEMADDYITIISLHLKQFKLLF